MEDHKIFTFSNGIRLIHKQVNNTKIIHCGIIINIGSRDELKDQQGIVHFWEHMAFKGTKKRKAYQIINILESVGGELNAFTTKEKICFYASVLDAHFNKTISLLTDITFNSIFPSVEIEKEKKVILDEMQMYLDLPNESLQDDFETLLFADHPMGRNILGNEKSITSFKHIDFLQFIRKNLNDSRIVISIVGNVPALRCRKIVEKHVCGIQLPAGNLNRIPPEALHAKSQVLKKNISRSYCAIGNTAYPVNDLNRMKFFMLTNIIGGPAMNSRLNMELREKRGLVYSVDASYTPYSDTGVFGIFFGTEKKQLERCIRLINAELKKLKTIHLGTLQLHKSKEQIIGQLAMAEENNVNLMIMLGRSLLDLGYVQVLDDIFNEIRKIQAGEIIQMANEIFNENEISCLVYDSNN